MKLNKDFWISAALAWGTIIGILSLLVAMLLMTGCGHNAVQYSDGIGLEIGFIPDQYQIAVNFRYGKILSAVVKEKAEVTLESTGGAEIGQNTQDTTTKATTRLVLKTGDQVTGYVVDLAEIQKREEK